MNIKVFLIVSFLKFGFAQGQVNQDSFIFDSFDKLFKTFDSSGLHADTTFRLLTHPSTTNYYSLFVLTKENGKWIGKFFEQTNLKQWTPIQIHNTNWGELWRRLVQNSVMSLPTEENLKIKKRKYSIDTAAIRSNEEEQYLTGALLDGTIYTFQTFAKEHFRTYTFTSPGSQLKSFPHIEEFYKASVIINLVNISLDQPMTEY